MKIKNENKKDFIQGWFWKKSIEFDVYTYPNGITKIQHPPLFYKTHKKTQPDSLRINKGIKYFQKNNSSSILVLDAKNKLVLLRFKKQIGIKYNKKDIEKFTIR